MMNMLEINYTADDARNDAIEYNNSLDKAVLCAENAIMQAAQKGCSGCSLTPYVVKDHWLHVKKLLEKAGYKVQVGRNFSAYW